MPKSSSSPKSQLGGQLSPLRCQVVVVDVCKTPPPSGGLEIELRISGDQLLRVILVGYPLGLAEEVCVEILGIQGLHVVIALVVYWGGKKCLNF